MTVEEEMEDDPFKNYSVNIQRGSHNYSSYGNSFKNYSVNILHSFLILANFSLSYLKTTQLIFYGVILTNLTVIMFI